MRLLRKSALTVCCIAILLALTQVRPIDAAQKEIIALVPENWPPQYQLGQDGEITGFAIDVMNEIANLGQFKVQYKLYPNFSTVVDALIAGEGDLIPNSGILSDRLDQFVFTSPVETFYVRIIVRKGDSRIQNLSDLMGKTVSVVEKNVGLFLLKDRHDLQLRIESDLQDALLSLISGNVDAILYPGSVALAMARKADIDDRIELVGEPVKEVKRGIRLLKGDEELRDQLEPIVRSFVKSEAYKRIYAKWYGNSRPFLSVTQIWSFFAVSLVLITVMFLVWRHVSLKNLNNRLRAENADKTRDLRLNQALLEAAGRTAKLGGWELDLETRLVRWTEQVYKIHDLPQGMQPKTVEDALSYYPENDRVIVEEVLTRAIEEGRSYDIETRFVSATGEHLWVRSVCQPQVLNGKVVKLTGTIQDITERKEAELELFETEFKYRNLFNNMLHEVHLWELVRDDSGKIETWRLIDLNSAAEKSWGKNRDEVIGKTAEEIFSPAARDLFMPIVTKIFSEGAPYMWESYFPDLDQYLQMNSVPWGEYFISTGMDITESKNMQLKIIEEKERAEALVQEKEILIQEVHHRVKNNLQVILSMLSLQKRTSQGDHEVHALNESSRRVRVMAKLYEHLYQSDNVSDIGPKEYLSEVLNDALHAAGASDGVEANLDCDDVTLKIKSATALAQIISELMSNCLKHAFPDGKGNIAVSLKRINEKELCLTVSDDGVGLPAGFDEKKLKSMGMKLVSALVAQIGGTKQIKSSGGTTVKITFEESA